MMQRGQAPTRRTGLSELTPSGKYDIALRGAAGCTWSRTNGVNTDGAAATVMSFDRLGEKVRPGTFGKLKVV